MKSFIPRLKYNERIQPYIGKELIKVVIGQRRVGKSVLLRQVRDELAARENVNFIYIDKENEEFTHLSTASELTEYVKANQITTPGMLNCLMVDEVQEITDFENSIRSFAARPDFDVYITGSNSDLLSGELASRLSGRYIEIPVFSLDFKEFMLFHDLKNDEAALNKYLKYGGMPFLRNLELRDELVFEYLRNVFDGILYRDIIARYNIRNVNFLDRLIHFVADNIGNVINAKKVSDYLKSQRVQISVNSVLDYLVYLENSRLIFRVKRMDLKGKRVFEIGEKFYFQDLGIRNAMTGYKISDIGQIMENVVFNHLISNGFTVYTGDWQQREIDFVAEKNNERVYIQVAYRIIDKSTLEREFGNLRLIQDNYKKLVVSMDLPTTHSIDGIEHWSLLQFLQHF